VRENAVDECSSAGLGMWRAVIKETGSRQALFVEVGKARYRIDTNPWRIAENAKCISPAKFSFEHSWPSY